MIVSADCILLTLNSFGGLKYKLNILSVSSDPSAYLQGNGENNGDSHC